MRPELECLCGSIYIIIEFGKAGSLWATFDLGKIDVEFKVDGYGGDNKEWTKSIPLMLASNNEVFFNRPINRRMKLMILCMGCG